MGNLSETLAEALLGARLHDPFCYLGLHRREDGYVLRVYNPHVEKIWVKCARGLEPFSRTGHDGVYEWCGKTPPPRPYTLRVQENGCLRETHDAYAFFPSLSEQDLYLLNEGRLFQAYRVLGSHATCPEGVSGIRFAVWAPNAERVSVVGDFNRWDGRIHSMAARGNSGVWELFIPGLQPGTLYKYELRNRHDGRIHHKTDPYAQSFELRPSSAARAAVTSSYAWTDDAWMSRRRTLDWMHAPLNAYEVHAGSWRRHPDGRHYTYRELAESLLPYAIDMGYTHIEFLPLAEYPLDESWGYQSTGYFAATSRYGTDDELRDFINACHQSGVGVILDWVPAHFPADMHALARFDGSALYEHEDPRLGVHQDWGTHIFNYGRSEVKSFLLSSAHYWLSEFHADGLRVDAVASMLYLDYSRKPDEWLPNKHGGRENLDAIQFLRELNIFVHREFPGALTIAEESTSWPMVSRPTNLGGLGFSMKWNMGWMNDTLAYLRHDPVHRRFHHNQLTFSQIYAYSENFVLSLSHDEVVHGKGSLVNKMPGDAWQKFANLRLLLSYQMTLPGKKLNFMGNEFAQNREWRIDWELDWGLLQNEQHRGVQSMMRDLNRLYRECPALHELDFAQEGFTWIDCHDADQSVLSFTRRSRSGEFVIVVLNFTPVPRHGYRVGTPKNGAYREIFNSDSLYYGGSNVGNAELVNTVGQPTMGQPDSFILSLPPLGGLILAPT